MGSPAEIVIQWRARGTRPRKGSPTANTVALRSLNGRREDGQDRDLRGQTHTIEDYWRTMGQYLARRGIKMKKGEP